MTDITNRVLPEPKNWQDFERLCFDLYSRMWKTNDAEMHGRQGQPQAGVDIYGTDRVEGRFVGVQCKGKDQGYGDKLTEAELRVEIKKAKTFEPLLEVFIVATTAPNDATIQRLARTITRNHVEQGLFEVRVQGWGTLQQRITDERELFAKHFPDLAPVDVVGRIDVSIAITEREGEQTRTEIASLRNQLTALTEHLDSNDPLQGRIIDASKLTDEGSAQAALRTLQRILKEDVARLSTRNLFRLRSGIGFARLALGDLPTAIQDFREAHAADPKWPSARAILAIAELLEGNSTSAFERAKQALADDPASRHAAAVIIDAAPRDLGVTAVEALIPVSLRDHVDIALGLSLRARKDSDFKAAEAYSRRAIALQSNDLRALSSLAEVLLEPILKIEGIGFTRVIPAEAQGHFDEALELLQRAWEQFVRRDDVARYDHIVANLITVMDIAGRESEAERILDQALRLAPKSPPLLRRHAQKMAHAGEWRDVLTTIATILAIEAEPQDELIKVQGLLHTGSAELALNEARALHEKFGDSRPGEAAAAMRLEAAAKVGSLHAELDATLSISPPSIVLRSIGVGLLDETDPRRQTLLSEIDALIGQITDVRDRFHAAEALYAAKQYSKAADLYEGLHGTDKDDVALRRHLTALHLADRRLEARQLFDGLDDRVKTLPQYAEAGAAIYERAGLLTECRDIWSARYFVKKI
jgi:cellulose synthase operon protein C